MSSAIISPKDLNRIKAHSDLQTTAKKKENDYLDMARGFLKLATLAKKDEDLSQFSGLTNNEARAAMLATWICQNDPDVPTLVKDGYSDEEICRLLSRFVVGRE